MKTSFYYFAAVAGGSIATPIVRRQFDTGSLISGVLPLMSNFIPGKSAMKIETDLKPTMSRGNRTVKRIRLLYGPYKIRGTQSKEKTGNFMSMDPAGTAFNYQSTDMPRDVTLLTTNSSWVLADGSEADINNGIYNHHLLVLDASKTAPIVAVCPNGRSVNSGVPLFSGSSEDKGGAFFTNPTGTISSGYYIGKNDKILMFADVVNYNNETVEVFQLSDFQYVEGRPDDNMGATDQLWDLGQCAGKNAGIVHPPEGVKQFSVASQEMTMAQDGYFLAFRGHLHDGGTNLTVNLNGKEICASHAKYGGAATDLSNPGEGTISEMTYCYPEEPLQVKKGDKLLLTANYDLAKHPPRKMHGGGMAEEMALMSIFFAGPGIK